MVCNGLLSLHIFCLAAMIFFYEKKEKKIYFIDLYMVIDKCYILKYNIFHRISIKECLTSLPTSICVVTTEIKKQHFYDMSIIMRKSIFGVSDKVMHKVKPTRLARGFETANLETRF